MAAGSSLSFAADQQLRCCRAVFFVCAAHHDLENVIRQRSLQRLRLIPWRAHPDIALLLGSQDHRHSLRMDGRPCSAFTDDRPNINGGLGWLEVECNRCKTFCIRDDAVGDTVIDLRLPLPCVGRLRPARNNADRGKRINGVVVLIVQGPFYERDTLRLCPRWREADNLAFEMQNIARAYRHHPA